MVNPKIALCLAELEKKTSELYVEMADKISSPSISLIMKFIGYDSLKHSLIFSEIAKMYGLKDELISDKTCLDMLGTFFRDALELLNSLLMEIGRKRNLTRKYLAKILSKLVSYESSVGEEYFVGFVASVFSQSYEEINISTKKILELIHEDEERHMSLIEDILTKLSD